MTYKHVKRLVLLKVMFTNPPRGMSCVGIVEGERSLNHGRYQTDYKSAWEEASKSTNRSAVAIALLSPPDWLVPVASYPECCAGIYTHGAGMRPVIDYEQRLGGISSPPPG